MTSNRKTARLLDVQINVKIKLSALWVALEQALILQSRLDTGKWESLSSSDPLPEKYLSSSWVWFLEETDEKTTRLIVRVRSDYNPGLLSTLSVGIPNELGSLVMQPKTLRVLKQRAEMSVR